MNFLLWLLGLFALAVALIMASHNPGFVMLVYPPYRMEMSLTLFVLLQLALFVLGYFAIRLALAALRLPQYVRQFRAERAHNRGRSAMMEALGAFFEGRYAAAEQAAVRAMELGEHSGINPIIAARSAHELRQFAKRDSYLVAAEGKSVGESTMRLMAQTKFDLDQHQPQAALESLQELRAAGVHGHIGALHLELKAQQLGCGSGYRGTAGKARCAGQHCRCADAPASLAGKNPRTYPRSCCAASLVEKHARRIQARSPSHCRDRKCFHAAR